MPHWNYVPHPEGMTLDEFHAILRVRRETIHQAAHVEGQLFPVPTPWRLGWKAFWSILGRSRDGSLLVEITVERPNYANTYVRRVRLQRSQPLPWDLGSEWRGT